MINIDLEKLLPLLKRGERVVLIMPGLEPLILMSVKDYDRLMNKVAAGNKTPANSPRAAAVETIDPLQGALADDDQYYPEPLE